MIAKKPRDPTSHVNSSQRHVVNSWRMKTRHCERQERFAQGAKMCAGLDDWNALVSVVGVENVDESVSER